VSRGLVRMHDENFAAADRAAVERGSALSVLTAFLKLGLMSFGGPVAHLGYFRDEFVARRKWLDEATYVDLVALCQFLPGPASSQVGISIGMLRAGLKGALAAWVGFTMPSALAMIAFAYGVASWADAGRGAWLHGLKIVAVAVVAQAVWNMARTLTPNRERATLAVGAAVLMLALPSTMGQIAVIVLGGIVGWLLLPADKREDRAPLIVPLSRSIAIGALVLFAVLLVGLPLVAGATASHPIKLIDSFYRSGSLVFGGGHVVLPLLQQQVVPPGWVDNDTFLAGYGAAQAVPGPLFTFAAYLGAVMGPQPNGVLGGVLCLLAIYLPSLLLLVGTLPFWNELRRRTTVKAALTGINAAVVGLLLAALYTPVWTSAIQKPADFAVGLAAFLLLAFWKVSPWLVVMFGAAAAQLLAVWV
jgi:chromate transporter